MGKAKILVVDDDQDLLRGLNLRLRAEGYSVEFAADGITAVTMAVKEKPDLIILDIGLPGGDGFSVMSRLHALAQHALTPIIVLTARDPLVNEDRARRGGAIAFLQKPADNQTLLSTIESALKESETPAAAETTAAAPKRPKILIVEDNLDLILALTTRLKTRGYDVVSAVDAAEAVRVARTEVPNLMLLDLSLPGGDGFLVMERLLKLSLPAFPIIIITGHSTLQNQERAQAAGVQSFLLKPVDHEVLMAEINKALA